MNRITVAVLGTFVVILILSGVLTYILREPAQLAGAPAAVASPLPGTQTRTEIPLLGALFGPDPTGLSPSTISSWEATSARIALRFSLAAFLAGLLAFRPRRGISPARRNPYVAQTQILMAVVAGGMMMVVGDSAARAFGIFAAASLVRFRTNIRDPKETTVLLVCLGVGLAAGVGRWDMAIILTLFVLISLTVLEYFEQFQVFRSMEVSVHTRGVDRTDAMLKSLFERHQFDYELRELDREDEEEPMGKIVYLVNLDPVVSTSKLSEEIMSSDCDNVDSVEWEQKDSKTYIYK
ncbi:MAG TPA: DUF4956 domain-containing protein [Pyrinomonadaceae bacterium]|nr:DUF4956 domain-containing protein [Pyrinomonadaceae bacterium]